MRGLLKLSPAIAAIVLAMACGDDDDNTPAAVPCKSPYLDLTAATLKAKTTSGKCVGDTETVCKNDMITATQVCAVSCNGKDTAPAAIAACTSDCLKMNASPTPSDGCTGCYVADVACTLANCVPVCLNPSDPACAQCRIDKGCAGDFYTCSGLPVPVASTGGTSSGGASSGGKTSTGGTSSGGTSNGGAPSAGSPGEAGMAGGGMSSAGAAAGGESPGGAPATGGSGGAGGH